MMGILFYWEFSKLVSFIVEEIRINYTVMD